MAGLERLVCALDIVFLRVANKKTVCKETPEKLFSGVTSEILTMESYSSELKINSPEL